DKNEDNSKGIKKQCPINNKEFEAMKKTANKYFILESLPEDDPVEIRILKDRMIGKVRDKDNDSSENEEEEDDIMEELNELEGNVLDNEISGRDNSILHQ
ncbi:hypothetical protein Tco_0249488, partial [Tanacetum coccineum]